MPSPAYIALISLKYYCFERVHLEVETPAFVERDTVA